MTDRPSADRPRIAILTVTHNDETELEGYFRALDHLEGASPFYRIVIVDSGSRDRTVVRLSGQRSRWPLDVLPLGDNVGFAAGMNRGLERIAELDGRTEWVVSLNADARPAPRALLTMAESLRCCERNRDLRVGAVTARLVRPEGEDGGRRLDACGMRLSPAWRHHDRGSDEVDRGQFAEPELVFGATGAGSLFCRQALLDVAVEGEVFDPLFHSFREDAELCFRLQERGWAVLYEPRAEIVHRRLNLPRRRREMSSAINFHSLKNRYLLRLYHQTAGNLLSTLAPTLVRELAILGYVAAFERTSLGVFPWLWRHRRRIRARRAAIQRRRTVAPRSVNRWFWHHRRSLPPTAG